MKQSIQINNSSILWNSKHKFGRVFFVSIVCTRKKQTLQTALRAKNGTTKSIWSNCTIQMDSIRLRVSGSAVIVVLEMSYDLTSNTRRKRNISEQIMLELIQLLLMVASILLNLSHSSVIYYNRDTYNITSKTNQTSFSPK